MTSEEYIEHEVKLRVHDALFQHLDYKFDKLEKLEKKVDGINSKFNWVIASIISLIVIPIILHRYNLV
jgi:hypothetical protein